MSGDGQIRSCTRSKPGWACIREDGHDGPCAAAPITGVNACPDIDRCRREGCQAKCGPGAKRTNSWRRHKLLRYGFYAVSLAGMLVLASLEELVNAFYAVRSALIDVWRDIRASEETWR